MFEEYDYQVRGGCAEGPYHGARGSALSIVRGSLPPGSIGEVAIYTPRSQAAHIIRPVMIRMTAIMNYVNPTRIWNKEPQHDET